MKKVRPHAGHQRPGHLPAVQAGPPQLEKSRRYGHILTLSPPLDLHPKWAGTYLAYTMAKYGMSLITLGLAEELKVGRRSASTHCGPAP